MSTSRARSAQRCICAYATRDCPNSWRQPASQRCGSTRKWVADDERAKRVEERVKGKLCIGGSDHLKHSSPKWWQIN